MTATTTLPQLIFLSGKKRSGKDTLAKLLHREYGYRRVAFADALKDEVADKWGLQRMDFDADDLKEQKPPGFAYTRRQLLQMHGRERRQIDPEYWTRRARQSINAMIQQGEKVVVTDARFANELSSSNNEFCTKDILKVRIERPALQMQDTDISETALDNWPFDRILVNEEGQPEQLLQHLQTTCA